MDRLYSGGKKSFVLSYRLMGQKKLMVIGNYGVLTVDEARNIAKLKLAELIQGKDPAQEKNKLAENRTMADFSSQYMKITLKNIRKHGKKIKEKLRSIFYQFGLINL